MDRIATLTLIMAGAIVGLSAQQPVEKQKGAPALLALEIKINIGAIDAKGNSVEDLNKEDIKLLEDGVEQTLSGLKKNDPRLSLTMVVDNTGSMRGQLDTIQQIGKFLVKNLNKEDELQMVRFVGRDRITLLNDWTADKLKLDDSLENLFVEAGKSAVVDALYLSVTEIERRRLANGGRHYALVLISDCEDLNSYYNQKQLLERMSIADVSVFVVLLHRELRTFEKIKVEKFATQLAFASGGSVYMPKLGSDVRQLEPLVNELRSSYTISYKPRNQMQDGRTRTVKIELAADKNGGERTAVLKGQLTVPNLK